MKSRIVTIIFRKKYYRETLDNWNDYFRAHVILNRLIICSFLSKRVIQ